MIPKEPNLFFESFFKWRLIKKLKLDVKSAEKDDEKCFQKFYPKKPFSKVLALEVFLIIKNFKIGYIPKTRS